MIKNEASAAFFRKHNEGRVFGETSNEYDFVKVFHTNKLEASYNQLKAFLKTEGFGYLSIPKDTDELYLMSNPEQDLVSVEIPPISISQAADYDTHLVLRINNENRPNYLLECSTHSAESQVALKQYRITQAIEFVATKQAANNEKELNISIVRLGEIAKALQEVNLDKTTILGALLQDGYAQELYTIEEVANEFGIEVAEAMHVYSYGVF